MSDWVVNIPLLNYFQIEAIFVIYEKVIFWIYNLLQNIFGKAKKLSQIGQSQKTLIFIFA